MNSEQSRTAQKAVPFPNKYLSYSMNLVAGKFLSSQQIQQVALLLLETDYYDYLSEGNVMGASTLELQANRLVTCFLDALFAVISQDGMVAAFCLAAPKLQIETMEKQSIKIYRQDTELKRFLDLYLGIYDCAQDSDFMIHSLGIDKRFRGLKLFGDFMSILLSLAKYLECTRFYFAIWASNTRSINSYKHYGAIQDKDPIKFQFYYNQKLHIDELVAYYVTI